VHLKSGKNILSSHGQQYQQYEGLTGRIQIPLTDLTLPQFCACPKPGPEFPTLYVKVLFGVQIDLN
jgi:hypothetical protein